MALLKIVLGTALFVVVLAVVAVRMAERRFDQVVQREVKRLSAGLPAPAPAPDAAALAALPPPVQRYLRFAMPAGPGAQRPVRYARMTHRGSFRMDLAGDWLPMTASEHYFTGRPTFLWNARIRIAPGLDVAVRDSLVEGHGGVQAKLLALLTVASASGEEVDSAALLRFVSELLVFPTAAWPSPWLRWEAVDDTHAKAIATAGAQSVEGLLTFDAEGRVTRFEGERYRRVGDADVRTPWGGTYGDYKAYSGLMVPTTMEGYWRIDGQEQPYVRIQVTDVRFETN